MNANEIQFQLCHGNAQVPRGGELLCVEDVWIPPREWRTLGLGIRSAFPSMYVVAINGFHGRDAIPVQAAQIRDTDRDEWRVTLQNPQQEPLLVSRDLPIAQFVILPALTLVVTGVKNLPEV